MLQAAYQLVFLFPMAALPPLCDRLQFLGYVPYVVLTPVPFCQPCVAVSVVRCLTAHRR